MAEQAKQRRWLRRILGLGLLAGAAYALWRVIAANRAQGGQQWEPQPFPFPPQPSTAPPQPDTEADVPPSCEPVDGRCPSTHPVKAKESSRIYHVPGGSSYERTIPDRCYVDAAAAEADGFRAAKR